MASSRCGFNLHFPDGQGSQMFFHRFMSIWIYRFVECLFKSFTHFLCNFVYSGFKFLVATQLEFLLLPICG